MTKNPTLMRLFEQFQKAQLGDDSDILHTDIMGYDWDGTDVI